MHSVMRLERALSFLFACAPLWAIVPAAHAQRPVGAATLFAGSLSFLAHATLGDFVGSTNTVTGALGGGQAYDVIRGWVEFPVATLATGNRLRDRDLRGSLEAVRYPTIRFEMTGATIAVPAAGLRDSALLLLRGSLSIHGVTRAIGVPAQVVRTSDTIHVRAVFPLDLGDYRIGGLAKMGGILRVRHDVEIRVDLHFVERSSLVDDAAAPSTAAIRARDGATAGTRRVSRQTAA